MLATLIEPYATMRGTIARTDNKYTRMYRGKCILQSKPTKSTPKQRAMRLAFGQLYAGRHPTNHPTNQQGG